jgi:hypothetical protein
MNGNGPKYVTLADDKTAHRYAETEATLCGLPVPIAGGANWTYSEPEKVCKACEKAGENAAPFDQRPSFEADTPLASDEPTAAPKATKERK